MLDDTCYFISFEELVQAQICTILLNTPPVKEFLKALAFPNTKRPFTKDILMRIDIYRICQTISYDNLIKYAELLNINHKITERNYQEFINLISEQSTQLKMFAT